MTSSPIMTTIDFEKEGKQTGYPDFLIQFIDQRTAGFRFQLLVSEMEKDPPLFFSQVPMAMNTKDR